MSCPGLDLEQINRLWESNRWVQTSGERVSGQSEGWQGLESRGHPAGHWVWSQSNLGSATKAHLYLGVEGAQLLTTYRDLLRPSVLDGENVGKARPWEVGPWEVV